MTQIENRPERRRLQHRLAPNNNQRTSRGGLVTCASSRSVGERGSKAHARGTWL